MFPNFINIHINIPSSSKVKPKDNASGNTHTFLKSQLDIMGVGPAWIAEALDYLVPYATSIFIWATIVAEFLQVNPQV